MPDASLTRHSQLPLFTARPDADDPWQVRVSPRARRLSVRVHASGHVEIVVPAGTGAACVHRFVIEHREWIDRKVREFARGAATRDASLPHVLELPGLGRTVRVDYRAAARRPRVVPTSTDTVRVEGDAADPTGQARALRVWLSDFAQPCFVSGLDTLCAATGLAYTGVAVRRQRTRWGSCSVRGMISVNVCLAFLEPTVVRYLLLHELCHTREMNHSRRFWALVERHEPDFRRLDRALSAAWQRVPAWIFR